MPILKVYFWDLQCSWNNSEKSQLPNVYTIYINFVYKYIHVCMHINRNIIVGRKHNIIVMVSDEFIYQCLLFSSLCLYLHDYIKKHILLLYLNIINIIKRLCLRVCSVASVLSNSLRPLDCIPPGSFVHGILQRRILKWVAMPSCRGSSQPRSLTSVS